MLQPRHATWFDSGPHQLMRELSIARVATDSAPVPDAGRPGGHEQMAYYSLHGSPDMYYSPYSD